MGLFGWSRPSHRFVSGARIIAASVAGVPVRASSRHRPIRISAPPRDTRGCTLDSAAYVKPEHAAGAARPWLSVEQPTVHTDRPGGRTLSAYLHRRGDRKWVRDGPFTVLGRASVCSLALIAARFLRAGGPGQGARSARAAAPQAPLRRPPGSGSWPAGARERTAGVGGFGGGWRGPFLLGDRGDLLRSGTGGGEAYLGPRALCRARRHDDRLGVLPPAGGCGRSVYTGRPPGPARQDRERLTADWQELAAVMPHRVSSAPARGPARPRQDGHHGMRCRAQAAVSASSPSSARIWQAWRRILRASEMAARLPSLRSLTAA